MKNTRGLTLIELMVTLGVLAILLGVLVPSFQNFSSSNKQSAAVNKLMGAFALARSEAVTRNVRVTLTAPGGDWANGWVLSESSTGTKLQEGDSIPTTVSVANTGPTTVEFNADGTLRTALTTNFAITLCDANLPSGSPGKQVSLIASGRYSVDKISCP